MAKENKELLEKNITNELEIRDKENEIEKMTLIKNFYLEKKDEFEELLE